MKQRLNQSRNFHLLLVGAENTGKTSLVSSFLREKFVEEKSATKGADDVEVCINHCQDWTRISQLEKSNILHNQFSERCKDSVLKKITNCNTPLLLSPQPLLSPHQTSSIIHSDILFTNVPLAKSVIPTSITCRDPIKPHLQCMQGASLKVSKYNSDSLMGSLWDFAGQVIFHNSHSVFISDSGVTIITFNASIKLTDKIITREGYPSSQPPECCTIVSSIHYWLQVVNSVCLVKENVLLAGTCIDKLHPDLKEARKIASNEILPILKKELCGKPYARHIGCIGEGLKAALKQSCFFVSNKY